MKPSLQKQSAIGKGGNNRKWRNSIHVVHDSWEMTAETAGLLKRWLQVIEVEYSAWAKISFPIRKNLTLPHKLWAWIIALYACTTLSFKIDK